MGNKPENVKTSVSAPMTKDLLMKYTFVALAIIAATSAIAFGITALIITVIALAVAVICDYLVSIVSKKKGLRDIYSSAVAGMIVALSFSSGIPYSAASPNFMMEPNMQYMAVAAISAITVILFKKIQGLLGRKYVNPAAAAKLLALSPIYATALIPTDHLVDIASSSGLQNAVSQMCYAYHEPIMGITFNSPLADPLLTLTVLKNHGWLGGASSIVVIIVGIALIFFSRNYVKWKIPVTYLATVAVISASYGFINGDDIVLRVAYHLFIGSSIFLAFFMATDPATTPLTGVGQIIFAIGLGILTLVFQLYVQFLGGSILALVIMNLMSPILDRVGIQKPNENRITKKLPKAKKFKSANLMNCIRCGKCMVSCCKNLSPILIKEAADKGNWNRVKSLKADYCDSCGHCSYMCPSRIELKGAVLNAKQKIQTA
jgi:electron transport complex protein RnfD